MSRFKPRDLSIIYLSRYRINSKLLLASKILLIDSPVPLCFDLIDSVIRFASNMTSAIQSWSPKVGFMVGWLFSSLNIEDRSNNSGFKSGEWLSIPC